MTTTARESWSLAGWARDATTRSNRDPTTPCSDQSWRSVARYQPRGNGVCENRPGVLRGDHQPDLPRGRSTPAGEVTLEGEWRSERQYVELRKGTGKIVVPFTAGEVNLVMQPGPSGNATVTVLLDGKPIGDARGADVGADGVARFDRSGMIRLVVGAARRRHVLTLVTSDPGVRAFAFTFGP